MSALRAIFLILFGLLWSRAALALENLALRQQWAVLRRTTRRPKLRPRDRLFWVLLRRYCTDWRSHLLYRSTSVPPAQRTLHLVPNRSPRSGRVRGKMSRMSFWGDTGDEGLLRAEEVLSGSVHVVPVLMSSGRHDSP